MPLLTDAEKSELLAKMCVYIPHARHQGIRLEKLEGDEVILRLPYRRELVGNPDDGAVHGGALSVLLDHALGICTLANDAVGPHLTPTLDLRIDHLGVAPQGRDIFAAARAYRVTRRIAFAEGLAWVESPDTPIARATGSWVIMRDVDLRQLLVDVPIGEAR